MRQKTFYVHGQKIVIKSRWSSRKMGFIVRINDKKYFNSGFDSAYSNEAPWADIFRQNAEELCYVRWVKSTVPK